MGCLFVFFKLKWAKKRNHRFETIGFYFILIKLCSVTTNGKDALKASAISAQHIIKKVPCPYTQRFTGKKFLPGVGCFVSCQVEEAIVNHRQRVGHGSPLFFGNRHTVTGFWSDFVGNSDNRMHYSCSILYHHRDHAIHPDWEVVYGLSMWLNKGDVYIHIRSHFWGDFQIKTPLCSLTFYPAGFENFRSIFDTDECPRIFC